MTDATEDPRVEELESVSILFCCFFIFYFNSPTLCFQDSDDENVETTQSKVVDEEEVFNVFVCDYFI